MPSGYRYEYDNTAWWVTRSVPPSARRAQQEAREQARTSRPTYTDFDWTALLAKWDDYFKDRRTVKGKHNVIDMGKFD